MTDCPNCEYHRNRAQLWRDEAYKQAGHPLPERGWVGLTDQEIGQVFQEKCTKHGQLLNERAFRIAARWAEEKLKEKNGC
jgi:hypothetical protein